MNADTGEAETPAHPRAATWRRDLDNALRRADAQHDRELDAEERVASMTEQEKDAMLKDAILRENPFGSSWFGNGGSVEIVPSSEIIGRLLSGNPISRGEARQLGGR